MLLFLLRLVAKYIVLGTVLRLNRYVVHLPLYTCAAETELLEGRTLGSRISDIICLLEALVEPGTSLASGEV